MPGTVRSNLHVLSQLILTQNPVKTFYGSFLEMEMNMSKIRKEIVSMRYLVMVGELSAIGSGA